MLRSRRRRCRGCGYDLFGLTSSRCPECGRPVVLSRNVPPPVGIRDFLILIGWSFGVCVCLAGYVVGNGFSLESQLIESWAANDSSSGLPYRLDLKIEENAGSIPIKSKSAIEVVTLSIYRTDKPHQMAPARLRTDFAHQISPSVISPLFVAEGFNPADPEVVNETKRLVMELRSLRATGVPDLTSVFNTVMPPTVNVRQTWHISSAAKQMAAVIGLFWVLCVMACYFFYRHCRMKCAIDAANEQKSLP